MKGFDVDESYNKQAQRLDFIKNSVLKGRYGSLAYETLRNTCGTRFCILGHSHELEKWVVDMNTTYQIKHEEEMKAIREERDRLNREHDTNITDIQAIMTQELEIRERLNDEMIAQIVRENEAFMEEVSKPIAPEDLPF